MYAEVVSPAYKTALRDKAGGIVMGIRRHLQFQTFRHLADNKHHSIGLVDLTSKWTPGPLNFRDVVALEWRSVHSSVLIIGVSRPELGIQFC